MTASITQASYTFEALRMHATSTPTRKLRPIHGIGTVTFRSDILQCVMSLAVSTVAVTVRAQSGDGQAKDLPLTVSGP